MDTGDARLPVYGLKKLLAYTVIVAGGVLAFAVLAPLVIPPVFAVAAIAIVIGCPVWVFLDARRLALRGAIFWALLAFFAPIVGTVIYLIARPDVPAESPCPSCGGSVLSTFALCPHCGADLPAARKFCFSCRHEIDPLWRYCAYCRVDLAQAPVAGVCPKCSLKVEPAWRYCPMCETSLKSPTTA
ncbi:MAG: zinc ribbon domain-containing protein [Planctomycetota bacterium]